MKNGKRKLPKGIVYREKENRYMGRFTYQGKQHVIYDKTIKDTQKRLQDLRYEVEHGTYIKESAMTFSDWFEIWIKDYKEPSVKRGTIEVYQQSYNSYIKDTFGNKQLKAIRTDQIQRFYNAFAIEHSHNTLEICRAILNGVFTQAVRNELLQKNPVSNTILPKDNKKKTTRVMTENEQKLFLKYAESSCYYPLYELALATGMRSGEIRGLQWSDVDFKEKIIHITCTLTYQNGGYHIETPKTKSSERDIPMLDNVYTLLKQQRKKQAELRFQLGELWNPLKGFENLVFTNNIGRPINRDMFKREIDDIVKEINKAGALFAHITPHTFRHTFATRSIENGIPPKVLQTILGHSELSITMDTYAHVLPNTKAQEMQKLASLFA